MNDRPDRRSFLKLVAGGALAAAASPLASALASASASASALAHGDFIMHDSPLFRISLAQWSLNRTIFAGELDPLEFPLFARRTFGITAVEYVNRCFIRTIDPERTMKYVPELRRRCDDAGMQSLLIMVDDEGALGDPDDAKRTAAIENHYKYVEAIKALGGHSIRVNVHSQGSPDEQRALVVDGLSRLTEFAARHETNVIVENHGGLSSNGAWLARVMREIDHPRCGTLPDFGNFCMDWSRRDEPDAWYDRYQGVEELMPFARAVSAKSNDFDENGNEVHTDYRRMLRIVLEAGYRGFIGVEWEGQRLSEVDGVRATKTLLERVRAELADKIHAEQGA